jgi:hypothetical protein
MSPKLTKLRIEALLYTGSFDRVQLLMGLVAAAWGLHMVIAAHSFNYVSHYRLLSQIAPEWFWGFGLLSFGVSQILALLFGGEHARGRMSWVAAGIWVFLSFAFGVSNIYAATSSVFMVFAIASGWICLRLR